MNKQFGRIRMNNLVDNNEDHQNAILELLDMLVSKRGAVAATAIVTFADGKQWKLTGQNDPVRLVA